MELPLKAVRGAVAVVTASGAGDHLAVNGVRMGGAVGVSGVAKGGDTNGEKRCDDFLHGKSP